MARGQSLYDWCQENGEWGQQLLFEFGDGNNTQMFLDEETGIFKGPMDFTYGSAKKIPWTCNICKYKWNATVVHRTHSKSGCPRCTRSGTSYPEQFLFRGLKQVFKSTVHRVKLFDNLEYDIFIPEINLCIEYSARYYHNDKKDRDEYKRNKAINNGYTFLNIVETNEEVEDIYDFPNLIQVCTKYRYHDKDKQLIKVLSIILNKYEHDILEVDINRIKREAEEYRGLKIDIEESISVLRPDLINEWDYNKNNKLGYKPENFRPGNNTKVFWICKKGHSWEDTIQHRNIGIGCPYCSNKKILPGYNDLKFLCPELAEEYSYENELTPEQIGCGSKKVVKWKCKRCNNIWESSVQDRFDRKSSCKICGYNCFDNIIHKVTGCKFVIEGINDVLSQFPQLAKEVNKIELNKLKSVKAGSRQEIAWVCSNCGYTWKASVVSRTSQKSGCSCCGYNCFDGTIHKYTGSGVITGYNDVSTLYPELIKECDDDIDLNKLKPGSNKVVNWKCVNCSNIWTTTIRSRCTRKSGCPSCGYNWFKTQTGQPQKLKKIRPKSKI